MESDSSEYVNRRYLQGISDEPKQLLQPIFGYAHEPLVTLEEACQPLLSIVPRLPPYIWIAKQNSKNPADGLTQDESAAIRLYTMEWDARQDESHPSLYSHLNRTLKASDRAKLRPWFRYLKLFLTALAKLPMQPRQTVWRGVRKDHSADYPQGAEVIWWAFSSCTTSLKVLESDLYLGNTGTRTLFSIETCSARSLGSHSNFTVEDEILLLPGTFLEVKSQFTPAPDLHMIHIIQKRPPHDILEPPFEGAQLMPPDEFSLTMEEPYFYPEKRRPWYKSKIVCLAICLSTLAIILSTVVLAVVLSQRNKHLNLTTPAPPLLLNISLSPPSVGNMFYAFDGNTLDLFGQYDGTYSGVPVTYVQGYVRQAIVFNQTEESLITVSKPFDLTSSSYTIEAFVIVQQVSMIGSIIECSSDISVGFNDGYLQMMWGPSQHMQSSSLFPLNEWHHVAFVYDISDFQITLYFDGIPATSIIYNTPPISMNNLTIFIGSRFQGIIDQLSIDLKAKSSENIFWDANVAAYYPLNNNTNWLFDHGPNGLNATSQGTQFVKGQLQEALNFNNSGAFYQSTDFTVLGITNRSFSFFLWMRAETAAGPFLTVTNSMACFIVLGLRNTDNRLIVSLPNSTATGENVSIIGPVVPLNQWIYVALTWSTANNAQLYTSISSPNQNNNATTLNNRLGLPMTVTLGNYHGITSCQNGDDFNSSQQFAGSLDEIIILSYELTPIAIQELTQLTNG